LAHAPVDRLEPGRRHAAGRAAFDPATGKVAALPAEAPPPPPAPPPGLEKLTVRWQGEAAGRFTAVVLEQGPDSQAFVLRGWDRVTGTEAPPRELLRGRRL